VISFRVPKGLKRAMREMYVNWSEELRRRPTAKIKVSNMTLPEITIPEFKDVELGIRFSDCYLQSRN